MTVPVLALFVRSAAKPKHQDYNKLTTNKKILLDRWLLDGATAVFLALLWLINLLPFAIKIRIGKFLGLLLYWIPNSRIRVTRTNIALCFPEMSANEQEAMVRRTFKNFGASLVESAMAWWDSTAKIHAMTETIGIEHLHRAQSQGRGVLLLGAHFSTIDLGSQLTSKSFKAYAMYREQTNRVLNWVMNRGRNRAMLGMIPHTSMRAAAKALRNNQIVWYSPDQDMGIENSVFVPFFNHPAATITATAKLAKLSGAPLVMLATYRKDDDSGYVVKLIPGPEDFPSGNEIADATIVNALIEQGIRCAPDQYYWFHRRFKSQPGLEKGALYDNNSPQV